MTRLIALGLSLSLSQSGCSFLMRKVGPGWEPSQKPKCTSVIIAPLLDAAIGGGLLITDARGTATGGDYAGLPALLVLASLPFLVATATGFSSAERCGKAKTQHREWLASPAARTDAGQHRKRAAKPGQRPPKPGELGGYCVANDQCNGDLVCDPATTRCARAAP